jgi:diguanylate cyclase (GGDEF)-like protein
LGELLQTMFRNEDITSRWGGDEFIIGLYGMTKSDGLKRLHQFLEVFQAIQFTSHGQAFKVSMSAGMAQFPIDGTDLQMLYQAADQALYQAKSIRANIMSTPMNDV